MDFKFLDASYYSKIIELWNKAGLDFKPHGRDSLENIKTQIERHPDMILGALDNGKLVGVTFITDDGRKGWINRLAVDPAYQRKGVAKNLIATAEQIFKSKGIKLYAALIEKENDKSQNLFLKMSYKKTDILYFSKKEFEEY
ncbi:MAG: GNAT family N-acetyltransferase [Thermoplasmata archaeon]